MHHFESEVSPYISSVVPACNAFLNSPLEEPLKAQHEHWRLTRLILDELLRVKDIRFNTSHLRWRQAKFIFEAHELLSELDEKLSSVPTYFQLPQLLDLPACCGIDAMWRYFVEKVKRLCDAFRPPMLDDRVRWEFFYLQAMLSKFLLRVINDAPEDKELLGAIKGCQDWLDMAVGENQEFKIS
jgi:hypothetical protein